MEGTPRHAELHALKSTNIKEPYEIVHLCVYFWWFHLLFVFVVWLIGFGNLGIWGFGNAVILTRWR